MYYFKNDACKSSGNQLMHFAMHKGNFSLVLRPSKEHTNCVSIMPVVAAIESEVRKDFLFLGFDSDL